MIESASEHPADRFGNRTRFAGFSTLADSEHEPGMGIGFVYESETERQRVVTIVERLMIKSLGKALYNKLVTERRRSPS